MKKLVTLLSLLILLLAFTACGSEPEAETTYDASTDFVLPVVEETEESGPGATPLDKDVDGTSGNLLAETVGPVTIGAKNDYSYDTEDFIAGAKLTMVEYLGEECLEITKNYNNEIRFAFMFDDPTALAGKTKMKFSIAGIDTDGGSWNFGILWDITTAVGLRKLSTYYAASSVDAWTEVELDLYEDQAWDLPFDEERIALGFQFWAGEAQEVYIKDFVIE